MRAFASISAVATAVALSPAYAQVYRCQSAGKVVMQQTPCAHADEKPIVTAGPSRSLRQAPYREVSVPPEELDKQIARDTGALREALKDPDSARMSTVRAVRFEAFDRVHTLTCGLVNAKNSYGGYTGEKSFLVFNGAVQPLGEPLLQAVRGETFGFARATAACTVSGYSPASPR